MMEKLRQLEREAITAFEKTRVSRIEKLHSGKASVVSFKKQLDQAFEFSNNLDLAKVPGTYKMEVKINGQRLSKSPFSFLLKVRELNIIGELDFP